MFYDRGMLPQTDINTQENDNQQTGNTERTEIEEASLNTNIITVT